MAFCFGGTIIKQAIERVLYTFCKSQRQTVVRWGDTRDSYGANMLRVKIQIAEGGSRSVRSAVNVQLVIAQCGPHVVEIGHCQRRRVETQVSILFQLGAAGAHPFNRPAFAKKTPQFVWITPKAS